MMDAQDPTNVSFPFLRRMRRDHGVSMALHYITMPHVRANFYFEADDARAAAFADNLIRPIYGSTILTVLRMLWAGYSPAVKNFQVVNPSWTYIVDGQRKRVWDSQVVDALVYKPLLPLRPESCRLAYDQQGQWNGIHWDDMYAGSGGFFINGQLTPKIDLQHSVWATHDYENEDGNPYGFPRIAHCAPIFHMYRYIWVLLGRAFETSADPGPIVSYPEDEKPVPDGDETNQQAALRIGRRFRSGSTIAKPSTPYSNYANDRTTAIPKWAIEYVKTATDFSAIQQFLQYLEALKFRALWLSEQSLTEGQGGSSSRNVVENLSSQRDESQAVLMKHIVDGVFMDQLVKPAFAINMPWYEGRLEMKTLGFGQDDEDIVRQVFQLGGQQDLKSFGIDLRKLAESQGFPMMDDLEFTKEMQKREQQAAQIANTSTPPAVEPTQGRRALVTQTGFGEMEYVQIHDPIDLRSREDGDFVASLPLDETWRDQRAVSAARLLRASSQRFLERSYLDLAILISKLRNSEHMNDVVAIVDRWLPRVNRVQEFLDDAKRALQRAYPSASESWLEERAGDILSSLSNNVRSDAVSLSEDQEPKAISEALRAQIGTSSIAAARIAQSAVRRARQRARIDGAQASGTRWAQLEDGSIVSVDDLDEDTSAKLLPEAPGDMQIRREQLEEGLRARYDESTKTVLLSMDITPEQEREYMLALCSRWVAKAS